MYLCSRCTERHSVEFQLVSTPPAQRAVIRSWILDRCCCKACIETCTALRQLFGGSQAAGARTRMGSSSGSPPHAATMHLEANSNIFQRVFDQSPALPWMLPMPRNAVTGTSCSAQASVRTNALKFGQRVHSFSAVNTKAPTLPQIPRVSANSMPIDMHVLLELPRIVSQAKGGISPAHCQELPTIHSSLPK